ncbi:hypothetical protein FV291_23430 [Escherichia coli]|nr:hypothetical protein FV291_23430 [Escherichia coli]
MLNSGYYLHENIHVCNIRVCVILIRSTSLFCMVFITVLYDGNDSNLLIVFYVQIMPDDFVMQLHRF